LNQKAVCPAAGDLDDELGEFWLENPWQPTDKNMSAYERNRLLLNSRNDGFADLSHASGGADLDSDSRAVVATDFDGDGMPDLLIRSSGGGPLRLFRNAFPHANSVQISLHGKTSDARGIGSQLIAKVGGQTLYREMQTQNCFRGQTPAEVRFGLQAAEQLDELEVRWPSGVIQRFGPLSAGSHYLITEGDANPANITNPQNGDR